MPDIEEPKFYKGFCCQNEDIQYTFIKETLVPPHTTNVCAI